MLCLDLSLTSWTTSGIDAALWTLRPPALGWPLQESASKPFVRHHPPCAYPLSTWHQAHDQISQAFAAFCTASDNQWAEAWKWGLNKQVAAARYVTRRSIIECNYLCYPKAFQSQLYTKSSSPVYMIWKRFPPATVIMWGSLRLAPINEAGGFLLKVTRLSDWVCRGLEKILPSQFLTTQVQQHG